MRTLAPALLVLLVGISTVYADNATPTNLELEGVSFPVRRLSVESWGPYTLVRVDGSAFCWNLSKGKGERIKLEDGNFFQPTGSLAFACDRMLTSGVSIDKNGKWLEKNGLNMYLLEGAVAKPLKDADDKPFSAGEGVGNFYRRSNEYSSLPYFTRRTREGPEICTLDGLKVTTASCKDVELGQLMSSGPMVKLRGGNDSVHGVFLNGKFEALLDENDDLMRGSCWPAGDYILLQKDGSNSEYVVYHVKGARASPVDLGKGFAAKGIFYVAGTAYVPGMKGDENALLSLADGKAKAVKLPRKLSESGRASFWMTFHEFALARLDDNKKEISMYRLAADGVKQIKEPAGKKFCGSYYAIRPCGKQCVLWLRDAKDSDDPFEDRGAHGRPPDRFLSAVKPTGELVVVSETRLNITKLIVTPDGMYCLTLVKADASDVASCSFISWPA